MSTMRLSALAFILLIVGNRPAVAQSEALASDAAKPISKFSRGMLPPSDRLIQIGTGTTANNVRLGQGVYVDGNTPILCSGKLITHDEPAMHHMYQQSVTIIGGESLISNSGSSSANVDIQSMFGGASFSVASEQDKKRLDRSLFVISDLIASVETIDRSLLDESALTSLARLGGADRVSALIGNYGLGYISAIHRGSRVLIHAEMKTSDESTKSELKAALNAGLLGVDVKGTVGLETAQQVAVKETMFSVYIIAGKSEGAADAIFMGWEELSSWLDKLKRREFKLGNHPLKAVVSSYQPLLLIDYPEDAAMIREATESLLKSSMEIVLEPPTVGFTPPHTGGGDSDYWTGDSNPTKCEANVQLSVVGSTRLQLRVAAKIEETGGNHTSAQQERSWQIFTAPPGWTIAGFRLVSNGQLLQDREFKPAPGYATREYHQILFPDDSPERLIKEAKIWATKRFESAGNFGRIELQLHPIIVVLDPT